MNQLSFLIRGTALGVLALSGLSCMEQPRYYQPDGNVFITDRPPRYGYRGTHSPNYNPEGPAATSSGATTQSNKPRPGESAADLHKPDNAGKPATGTAGSQTGSTGKPPTSTGTASSGGSSGGSATTPPPAKKPDTNLPYGTPVIGKKGFVYSPYAPEKGMVDVTDIPSGTKVECPYTQKIFRVP